MKVTIAVIVAMQKELNLLLPLLRDTHRVTIDGTTYHQGTYNGGTLVLAQCGIGKVNAALSTQVLIDTFHPACIVNTGVAGGTGHGADVMDVVLGTSVAYHDVWCGPGTQPGQAANCPPTFDIEPTFDTLASLKDVKRGLIASGDIFVSRPDDLQRIQALYPDVMAVDMESGAVAQVCYLKHVPFIALRVVSDTPGRHNDNASQYEDFWTLAPQQTFEVVRRLLDELFALFSPTHQ